MSILKARQPPAHHPGGRSGLARLMTGGVFGGAPLAMHALWHLADEPLAVERLRGVCASLRQRIDADSQLRAACLVLGACKHTVLSYAAARLPHALTPSVFFALVAQGVSVPKYFVELLLTESLRTQESVIPQDTVDHLVAIGFKMYGDALIVGGSETGEIVKNDLWWYQEIARGAVADVDTLKAIVYNNHFTPALVSINDPFWAKFWINVRNILKLDFEIGKYLLQHTGLSVSDATDKLLYEAICDPTSTASTISDLQKHGFAVTKETALLVLTNPNTSNTTGIPASINLLKWIIPEETLLRYVQSTFTTLFKTMPTDSSPSQHQIDTLLRVFKASLSDTVIAKSILAEPPSQTAKLNRTLPFMTAFGQTHGGVADAMWQVICAEYGAEHAFVAAFLVDVVIGGTIVDDKGKKQQTSKKDPSPQSTTAMSRRPSISPHLVKQKKSIGSLTVSADSSKNDTIVVVAPDGVIRKKSLSVMTKRRESAAYANSPITPSSPGGVSMGSSGGGSGLPMRSRTLDSRFSSFRSSFSGTALPLSAAAAAPAPLAYVSPQEEEEEYDDSDDRDRDVAARETIQAMVDGIRVPIDPGMLIPICRAVLILKSVRSRVVDFMARAEKEILKAAYSIDSSNTTTSATYNRLSKTKWISSLYRNVIDSQAWMENVMTTSELTVLEGLKPAPASTTAATSTTSTAASERMASSKRRTGIHPPVPGIFATIPDFAVLLESAGDASVVEMDSGPIPSSVQAVARSVRMRRQKSISSAPPVRRSSFVPAPIGVGGSVGSLAAVGDVAAVRRFYKCCEELVLLLENAQRGAAVGRFGDETEAVGGVGVVIIGPFQKWLEEKDASARSWNGWFKKSALFNGRSEE